MDKFKPIIGGISVVKPKNYHKKKLKNKILEGIMKDRFTPFDFEVITLAGNKYTEVLIDYIEKTNPDLIVSILTKKSLFNSLLQKKRNEKLLQETNIPVLLVK